MAAAAATLLVVVPAKPLRAKQRLAAPRISCRRKSLVIRRFDMGGVSNYSLCQKQGNILHRTQDIRGAPQTRLERRNPQRTADAVHNKGAVPHRQGALQVGPVDLDIGETGAALEIMELWDEVCDLRHGGNGAGCRNTAG